MTGTISPDGQWLWNGSEWIPAPPTVSPEVVQESAPFVQSAATEHNLNIEELQTQSQYFDLNQDNQLSQNEVNFAAQSMVNPPNVGYPNHEMFGGPQMMPDNQMMGNPQMMGGPQMMPDNQMMGGPQMMPDNQMMGGPQMMPGNQMDAISPFTDNFAQMMIKPRNNNNKAIISVVILFVALIIGSVSIYFWASSLADDEQSLEKDTDKDGVADDDDAFIDNPTQWEDSDGDGWGDNQSAGATQVDDFPDNPTQYRDTDGDGYGDNQSSGATQVDAFIYDSSEHSDWDGDGYGDNSDEFPYDSSEHSDWDGDGYGDNSDAFPYDSSEWFDSDGDGYGNNEDLLPSGNAYIKFRVNSLTADNNDNYDFGTAPDMYLYVQLDWDCDDDYEVTLQSSTNQDDYYVVSSDYMSVQTDIAEDESQICFSLKVYDEDGTSDDILDYVSGNGQSYVFTRTITQSGTISLVYSSSDYKSVDIDIDVYIY